ncbi:MAG TPA: hypothetical protein VMO76_17250 [Candidatus Udaeobacter sp.]|jgi:hypothetical protein|nr:hypothetical protein [Candidatus Udaeobacter sp.]
MQCRDVEAVVEQEGLAPLPAEARAHVAGCQHCQAYLADHNTIVSIAKEFPAEIEPPARVWVSLRTQLALEGIIKDPASLPAVEHSSSWKGFGDLFGSRTLATAAVGLLIVAAGALQLQHTKVLPAPPSDPIFATAHALDEQERDLTNMQLASTSPVDASLRQSLKQLDEFIADCERRVKEEPRDDLAREYLAAAYQQKAELLSAMMDRGRSVN